VQHFEKSLHDAATELGLCATAIKKACRRFGIPRWPFRDRHRSTHQPTTHPQPPAPVPAVPATVDTCQFIPYNVRLQSADRSDTLTKEEALSAAPENKSPLPPIPPTNDNPPIPPTNANPPTNLKQPVPTAPTNLKHPVPTMPKASAKACARQGILPHSESHVLPPLMRQVSHDAPRNHVRDSMLGDALRKSGAASDDWAASRQHVKSGAASCNDERASHDDDHCPVGPAAKPIYEVN
jgi:hypothetical protein